MLRRGDAVHGLGSLFCAFERSAGSDAAAHSYDRMATDELIPSAPFLWYRKQELIASQPPRLSPLSAAANRIYSNTGPASGD